MSLKGSLQTVPLPEVLQFLSDTAKSGELHVCGTQGEGRLWFDTGRIAAFDTRGSTEPFEAVYELLRIGEGDFDFAAGHEAPDGAVHAGEASMADILQAAEARLAEWLEIVEVVPSLHHQLRLVPEAPEDGVMLEPDQWSMIVAVGDGRSVGEVLERAGRAEFEGCRAVRDVVAANLLSVHPPLETASQAGEEATAETLGVGLDGSADEGIAVISAGGAAGDAMSADEAMAGTGAGEAADDVMAGTSPDGTADEAMAGTGAGETADDVMAGTGPDIVAGESVADASADTDADATAETGASAPAEAVTGEMGEAAGEVDEPAPAWSADSWSDANEATWAGAEAVDDGRSLPGSLLRFGVDPAPADPEIDDAPESTESARTADEHPVTDDTGHFHTMAMLAGADDTDQAPGSAGAESAADRYAALRAAVMEVEEIGVDDGYDTDSAGDEGPASVYQLGVDEHVDGRAALQALLSEVTAPDGYEADAEPQPGYDPVTAGATWDRDPSSAAGAYPGGDGEVVDGLADRGPWTEHELAVMDADSWTEPGEGTSNILPFPPASAEVAPVEATAEEGEGPVEEEAEAAPAEEPVNRGLLLKFLSSVRN